VSPSLSDGFTERFISFALAQPAKFGRENFAGDPIVEIFVNTVRVSFSIEVDVYVAWECPPDVVILTPPSGNVLIRSERLDTLLVEFHRLREILPTFGGELAREVPTAQIYRWMAEFLIGYRNSSLALDALELRPDLTGLQLGIWNPFRDETLASIPQAPRIALQCFSMAHEIGHLRYPDDRSLDLYYEIDGLSVMSHLDYDARQNPDGGVEAIRKFATHFIDAPQLISEMRADLFALECVGEFLSETGSLAPETAVALALSACEALIFVYHCKEICRLIAQLASGSMERVDYDRMRLADQIAWVGRARAIGRRAGLLLARLEGGDERNFARNVPRIDAIIRRDETARLLLEQAMGMCAEALADAATAGLRPPGHDERLRDKADLRLELFYILIAFGCPGGVDVIDYLRNADSSFHRLEDRTTS